MNQEDEPSCHEAETLNDSDVDFFVCVVHLPWESLCIAVWETSVLKCNVGHT